MSSTSSTKLTKSVQGQKKRYVRVQEGVWCGNDIDEHEGGRIRSKVTLHSEILFPESTSDFVTGPQHLQDPSCCTCSENAINEKGNLSYHKNG